MAKRWIAVPQVQSERRGHIPKYTDRDGLTGFSGNTVEVTEEDNLPTTGVYYIARFFGDQSTLDQIASEPDAYTTADATKAEIERLMTHILGYEVTFEELQEKFK